MQLSLKKLRDVPTPRYGRAGDAALDLYCCLEAPLTLAPGQRASLNSGVAMAIPAGYVGLMVPRSGLGSRGLNLMNAVGVIDSNYRGEIIMNVMNNGAEPMTLNHHDRVMQMMIVPVVACDITEVADLDDTSRGVGAFGSSGQ